MRPNFTQKHLFSRHHDDNVDTMITGINVHHSFTTCHPHPITHPPSWLKESEFAFLLLLPLLLLYRCIEVGIEVEVPEPSLTVDSSPVLHEHLQHCCGNVFTAHLS